MKKTWSLLKEVTGKKNNSKPIPKQFVKDDVVLKNEIDIVNEFNIFFTNIGPNLAKTIPPSKHAKITDYLPDFISNTMFLMPVTNNELLATVSQLANKKSQDHDDLDMSTVKVIVPHAMSPLLHIFNLSFTTGKFPDNMKIAKVIPLFKSGTKSDFSNYRPISLLPQFSKILEKLFCARLVAFVEKNKILFESQYGFRHNHSTGLALAELVEYVTEAMDKKDSTIGVFIDLKKAFDTVDHSILIKKLDHYGIRGLASTWIQNYLYNRKQYVAVSGLNSHMLPIACGVPQGSILGPILFILYINDMSRVSDQLKFIIFADDTNIFHSSPNLDTAASLMNRELEKLNTWFKVNKLSLNIKKTNYMLFGSNSKKKQKPINIVIDNQEISKTEVTKFLGVFIDSHLSWNHHIDALRNKLSKSLGIMYRARHFLESNTLYLLYCSLITPYLDYCCEIWGATSRKNLNKIEIMQKKAIRIVAKSSYDSHTAPLFRKFNTLKLQHLISMKTCCVMYKANKLLLPGNLQGRFTKNTEFHNHKTRSNHNFHVSNINTSKRLNSVLCKGKRLWNSLPVNLKNCFTIHSFKHHFKEYCFTSNPNFTT